MDLCYIDYIDIGFVATPVTLKELYSSNVLGNTTELNDKLNVSIYLTNFLTMHRKLTHSILIAYLYHR